MTAPTTWTWAPVLEGEFRAGLASRDDCIKAAKAEGVGEIFIQRIDKADPSPAILDGNEYIQAMLAKAAHTMPDASDELWLKNVPPPAVRDLTNLLYAMTRWWLSDHRQNPGWTVVSDMEAVVLE